MATSAKRPRRSSTEVRSRLLEAARELFLARGFDATTTKDISERAGVAEKLLFGNFGSKDGIFDAAVVEPFSQLVGEYVAAWAKDAPSARPEDRITAFVTGLYELASRNRTVLRAAWNRRLSGAGTPGEDILGHLATTLHSITTVQTDEVPEVDQPAALVATAGMVFGVVLLDEMLFPAGHRRPSRSRLTAEMVQLVLHGVIDRPVGAERG